MLRELCKLHTNLIEDETSGIILNNYRDIRNNYKTEINFYKEYEMISHNYNWGDHMNNMILYGMINYSCHLRRKLNDKGHFKWLDDYTHDLKQFHRVPFDDPVFYIYYMDIYRRHTALTKINTRYQYPLYALNVDLMYMSCFNGKLSDAQKPELISNAAKYKKCYRYALLGQRMNKNYNANLNLLHYLTELKLNFPHEVELANIITHQTVNVDIIKQSDETVITDTFIYALLTDNVDVFQTLISTPNISFNDITIVDYILCSGMLNWIIDNSHKFNDILSSIVFTCSNNSLYNRFISPDIVDTIKTKYNIT